MAAEADQERDAKGNHIGGKRMKGNGFNHGENHGKVDDSGRYSDRDEDGDLLHQSAGLSGSSACSGGPAIGDAGTRIVNCGVPA